ncbi:MAG: hypothetical protein JNK05_28485 [Myxococcales bacterium]|nr:hypothetical protein [Myxococcales bacterium]
MTEKAVVEAVDATKLFAPMPIDAELTDVASWEHDAVDAIRSRGVAAVLGRVLSVLATQPTLLMLDEFSRFLRNTHRDDRPSLDAVLATLAQARRSEGQLRMVLCGSGGLKAFSASANLPVVDAATMETIALPALSAQHATLLLEELLYGHDRWPTSTCAAAMHAALGDCAVPHFVHHLVRATLSEIGGEVVDQADVRRAYRNGLLGSRGNATFREYSLHKQAYPSTWLRAARGILDRLATEGEAGLDRAVLREAARDLDDSQFDELLSCLDEDYDVGSRDGRIVARCKPLRDRWLLREQWLVSDR